MSPLISLDTDESLRWRTGLERVAAELEITEWGRTGRCVGAERVAESWQHCVEICVEIWVERGAGCPGLRGPSCRAVSRVAYAGRAGAVTACGGVWYGRSRGAQRPYGTEAGEGDVWPVGGLECAEQRRPGHTNVNSAFCRDTRNEVV